MTEICQTLLMAAVVMARGESKGVESAVFKNVFDVYNFFIISSLFDSDKP